MAPATLDPPHASVEASDHYEIINGQRVELPPMGCYAATVAGFIFGELFIYYRRGAAPGRPTVEALFAIPTRNDATRNRKPDVAFVSYDRWPADRPMPPRDNAWPVVPDLVVEVVSPTDVFGDLLEKVEEYLTAGVRIVWLVDPLRRIAQIYTGMDAVRQITQDGVLDGGTVLPGFTVRLGALLDEVM